MSLRAQRGVRCPMRQQASSNNGFRASLGMTHPMAAYDIQLTPASRFHFVVIFFDCVQNSIDPRPVMSPTPNLDSFHPPNENGSRGTGTPTFTPTIPALARSIT